MRSSEEIRSDIKSKGLKITPQRVWVMEAIYSMNNHPTAEKIIEYIRKSDPNVAAGTVYNVLETLVKNGLIRKVMSEKEVMRYEGLTDDHHHLYCKECDHIEDYVNEEVDKLLKEYFERNKIENFDIEEIKLNISGNFIVHKSKNH